MRGLTAESSEIRTIAVIVPDSPNKPSRTMLTLETQVGRASNIVADLQTGKFKVRKAQRFPLTGYIQVCSRTFGFLHGRCAGDKYGDENEFYYK